MSASSRPDTASSGQRDACWVLTDGKVGMEVQCRGLAEALGCAPVIRRIVARAPWRWLPPALWGPGGLPLRAVAPGPAPESGPLRPPWPRLLIATGRLAAAPAAAIKRQAGAGMVVLQIQDPRLPAAWFDAIIVPEHDTRRGETVLVSTGALNPLTEARLAAAAAALAPGLAALPRPLVTVLLGGTNKHYRFTAAVTDALAARLHRIAAAGATLLVTPSRRTPDTVLATLRAALAGQPARIWDGSGDNPYVGWLGLADHVVVTEDSVNMVSEAAFTGKPVHVVALAGRSAKFARFHAGLRQRGCTRPLDLAAAGGLPAWDYAPLRETTRIAAAVRARFGDRLPG